MAELAALLNGLPVPIPPNADPTDKLQSYLDTSIFPLLPNAFWYQVYAAIVCLSLVILANLGGLSVRAARGQLQFIVKDGCCTRLDWRTGIPILWSLEASLQIVLLVVFRHNLHRKSHDTRFFGSFWALVHMTLVFSYTLLTLSVLASYPPLRKALSKIRYGPLVFNGSWLLISTAMLAALVPFGLKHGDAMRNISRDYNEASRVIQAFRASGDLQQLANLPAILQALELHNKDFTHYRKIVIGLYNLVMVVLLATGILPSIWLVRNVKRKIIQLESTPRPHAFIETSVNIDTSKANRTPTFDGSQSQMEMEILSHVQLPPPKSNQPFGNLLEVTSPRPPRFEIVLQDKSFSRAERAARLRRVLRIDMLQLAVLLVMELAFFAICLFWFFQKEQTISPSQNFQMSIAYVAWNFLIFAASLASFFLYESISPDRSLAVDGDMPQTWGQRPARQYAAPNPVGISCTQVIAVDVDKRDNLKEYEDKDISY